MSAERSVASRVHAPGPRLHGVPVPLRAFGFGAGWRRADGAFVAPTVRPATKPIALVSLPSSSPSRPGRSAGTWMRAGAGPRPNLTIDPEVAAA